MKKMDGGEWGVVSGLEIGCSLCLTIPFRLRKLLGLKPHDRFVVYYAKQGDAALIIYKKTLNDSVTKILETVKR